MGTDIHMVIEYRTSNDGKWQVDHDAQFDDYRNYDSFAILANVRNGYGFAGVPTGEGFQVMSLPRGIPNDISFDPEQPNFKQKGWIRMQHPKGEYRLSDYCAKHYPEGFEFWLGDHSFSWLTLKEIKDFNMDQETISFGVLSESEYVEYKRNGGTGKPESYCGDVSGYGIETVNRKTMDDILDGNRPRKTIRPEDDKFPYAPHIRAALKPTQASYHVRVKWKEKYSESAPLIMNEIIPAMEKTAKMRNCDPENVRLVFGFDS